ncbi:M35 family metallo-endopeptidase [Burkholderia aenigmatica]|uniref:M35 family metallo-endopeptidase n=1 Tax=Burkholderia aenigmatica TaxID=2015348 RepID=UPI00264CB125|nr:M35 family metallo-endopeptidase [Burkholderia aenigmatica]MDN7874315.1 M35 family metallo-endopeptidase [Burkholderia aenigmatica]
MANQTTVAETTTNTVEGSQRFVDVDMRPICENMTNSEFRIMFAKAQVLAVSRLEARVASLKVWSRYEKDRVFKWFGRDDDQTRTRLLTGLAKVLNVVRTFNEHNVVRTGSAADLATGCTPHPLGTDQEAAHVCAPDTATHTFSISPEFCTMRPWTAYADSQVSVIIHEASHFLDTMAATDDQYYITPFLPAWGRSHPDLAINNAESIAGYVVDGD